MKSKNPLILVFGSALIVSCSFSSAAEIAKAQNIELLSNPASWVQAVVPGPADIMLWDSNFTTPGAFANLSQLGADISVAGLKVTNVGGTRNLATTMIGFQNASSSNTLTIGSSGVDMASALQSLRMAPRVLIGADQTWNIANANSNGNPAGFNNGEDLSFAAEAAAVPFNFNGHTVTKTGAGSVTITSGYTLSNGTYQANAGLTVIQGGASRVTTLNPDLVLIAATGGTIRLQANSGAGGFSLVSNSPATADGGTLHFRTNTPELALTQSGPITLNAGILRFELNNAAHATYTGPITFAGNATWDAIGGGGASTATPPTTTIATHTVAGNILGPGNVNYTNGATNAASIIALAGDNSGYTGTFTLNGGAGNRSLRLQSPTSGSAAASWVVNAGNILQIHGTDVQLGTLEGSGSVINSHPTDPASITVGAGNFQGSLEGMIEPVSLTKVSAETLTLSLPFASIVGDLSIEEGSLFLNSESAEFSDITVATAATLGVIYPAGVEDVFIVPATLTTAAGSTILIDRGSSDSRSFPPLEVGVLAVNGPTTLQLRGIIASTGSIPIISTSTNLTGAQNLSLILPPRIQGSLVTTANAVSANITGINGIRWEGSPNGNWDIDPNGDGSGGNQNWRTTSGNAATGYIQTAVQADTANFTDAATGTTTVNLTTQLTPGVIHVNNSANNYTFTGSGAITGPTRLIKEGTGTLTLANTGTNDFIGGTVIHEGSTLIVGDGLTAAAGILPGAIENNGILVLNRADDFAFAGTLTGTGTLRKQLPTAVTMPAAFVSDQMIELIDGTLAFPAGGTLEGTISGTGGIEAAGGTLLIAGSEANTFTGPLVVSAGVVQLSKPSGVNAIGGDLTITGDGRFSLLAEEQIPDTATINMLGNSADPLIGISNGETIANAYVNVSNPAGQLVLRNSFTITGIGRADTGILGISSGATVNINAVELNSPTAILRIAGGSNASVLNVGEGGITASGGRIEVKFSTSDFDATVNLGGDVTTTGNVAFDNGGYTGASINLINLIGDRTFNIGAGTITTVNPDFGGSGKLIKAGAGTLTLNAPSNAAHQGGTQVAAGVLRINGPHESTIQVDAAGTLGGSGGAGIAGAINVNGTLSPGTAVGTLNAASTVTMNGGSTLAVDVGNWAGNTAGTDWDLLSAQSLAFTATPGNPLTISVSGSPEGFSETAKTLRIADSAEAITGFNAAAIQVDASGFIGTGTWQVQSDANSISLVYTAGEGTPYTAWAAQKGLDASNNLPSFDADDDGLTNLAEFALDSDPLSGAAPANVVVKIATVGGERALTYTLPVRIGAVFAGATEQVSNLVDGVVIYRIQGSDDLSAWNLQVAEVTGADAAAIQAGIPAPSAGWTLRTFRSPGPVAGDPREFLRAVFEQP